MYEQTFNRKINNNWLNVLRIVIIVIAVVTSLQNSYSNPGYWKVTALNNPSPGYLKFYWLAYKDFSLWDNYGKEQYVDSTNRNFKLINYELLNNGLWIAAGNPYLTIHKYYLLNQNQEIVDSIPLSTAYMHDFHDVLLLSNGHYLVLYMNNQIVDMSKIIEGGNPNAVVLNSILVETDRTGTVYWTWNALDHMDVTDITSGMDLRSAVIDFPHANSFCEDTDGNIIVSFRYADEISKIDKETGEFIWRLGGSLCANNQFTFTNDNVNGFTGFTHQHSVTLLPNGNLLVYDNGNKKEPRYSRAVEYSIDVDGREATKVWEYRYTPDIFVGTMGSAFRLPNGNTLISWGQNRITEVTNDKQIAFEMVWQPDDEELAGVYRAFRYVTKLDAVSKPITGQGEYAFSNAGYNTGINLNITSLSDTGTICIEKHNYAPPVAAFNDSGFTNVLPYRWVALSKRINSLTGTILINTVGLEGVSKPQNLRIYQRSKEATGTFVKLNSTYNSQTKKISAPINGLGEFVMTTFSFSKPQILYPEIGDTNISVLDTAEWEPINKAEKYQYQVSTDSDFSNLVLNRNNLSDTKLVLENLFYDTQYYCRLRGFNDTDTSDWSDTVDFKTMKIPAVKLLFPLNESVGFFPNENFRWHLVDEISNYFIQFASDSSFKNIILETSVNDTLFLTDKFDYYTKYYWRVRGIQNNEEGAWSKTWSFVTKIVEPELISPAEDSLILPQKITFIWDSVSGAKSYKIQVSESTGFSVFFAYNSSCVQQSFSYLNFLPNRQYFWRVAANGIKDTSLWSDVFSFKTVRISPKLIYPSNNQLNVGNNVLLKWDSIITASSYHIQLIKDSVSGTKVIDLEGIHSPYYYCENLLYKTDYYWRARASYNGIYSEWPEYRKFSTGSRQEMTAPKLILPSNNQITYINGTFTWERINGATGYEIQVAEGKDFINPVISVSSIHDTTYQYKDLLFEKKYYWRIRCFTNQDTGKWSPANSFVTQPAEPKPVYPALGQRQLPAEIEFRWEKSYEVDYYQFQLSTRLNFSTYAYDSLGFIDTALIIEGLKANTDYFWRLRYFKNGLWHNWSQVYSFTTAAKEVLSTPKLEIPSNKSKGVPVDCRLAWEPVAGAEYYRLSVSGRENFDQLLIEENELTSCEYSRLLEFNSTYYWRVSAGSSKASSPWSQVYVFRSELPRIISLYPPDGELDVPADGTAGWEPSEDTVTYSVRFSEDSAFGSIALEQSGIKESYFKFNLIGGKKYFWNIKSENSYNYSTWSKVKSFSTRKPNSVIDNDKSGWTTVPIPANDYIILENRNSNGCETSELRIYNCYGEQTGFTQTINNSMNIIGLKDLAPGVYSIIIRMNTGELINRLIIKD